MIATATRRHPKPIGVVDLVRDALRMRPDRIVVGETRDGAAALETLKAWNTGHPGGLFTLHANSAGEALSRLEDLWRRWPSARRAGPSPRLSTSSSISAERDGAMRWSRWTGSTPMATTFLGLQSRRRVEPPA